MSVKRIGIASITIRNASRETEEKLLPKFEQSRLDEFLEEHYMSLENQAWVGRDLHLKFVLREAPYGKVRRHNADTYFRILCDVVQKVADVDNSSMECRYEEI